MSDLVAVVVSGNHAEHDRARTGQWQPVVSGNAAERLPA